MRGAATLAVVHTFKAFLFAKRVGPGRGLLWGSPWALREYSPFLPLSLPRGSVGCVTPGKSSSHPTIQQLPDNCAWRDVTWRDTTLLRRRNVTLRKTNRIRKNLISYEANFINEKCKYALFLLNLSIYLPNSKIIFPTEIWYNNSFSSSQSIKLHSSKHH